MRCWMLSSEIFNDMYMLFFISLPSVIAFFGPHS